MGKQRDEAMATITAIADGTTAITDDTQTSSGDGHPRPAPTPEEETKTTDGQAEDEKPVAPIAAPTLDAKSLSQIEKRTEKRTGEPLPKLEKQKLDEKIASGAERAVIQTKRLLEKTSTPGSITLPLLLLALLWFLIIPVNGKPRIGWLWSVIVGDAGLQRGAGADFGEDEPVSATDQQNVFVQLATVRKDTFNSFSEGEF